MTPDLITRLEAAVEGSRELDGLILSTLKPAAWEQACRRASQPSGAPIATVLRDAPKFAPHYTTSIDAAVALFAERLPGWAWRISAYANSGPEAFIWRVGEETPQRIVAATPALALCIALLKALRALTPTKEGSEDHGV